MGHISEDEFRDTVVIPWLREQHPEADMETERYLDHVDPGVYADVWLDLNTHSLAIEVGTNDSTIREEAAQAVEYAGYSPTAVPVVVVPVGHGKQNVVDIFEGRGVMIWMLPTD